MNLALDEKNLCRCGEWKSSNSKRCWKCHNGGTKAQIANQRGKKGKLKNVQYNIGNEKMEEIK